MSNIDIRMVQSFSSANSNLSLLAEEMTSLLLKIVIQLTSVGVISGRQKETCHLLILSQIILRKGVTKE